MLDRPRDVEARPRRPGLSQRVARRLDAAFATEELDALRLAALLRAFAVAALAVAAIAIVPPPAVVWPLAILALFLLLGLVSYALARGAWARPWQAYLFVALDFALLSFTLTMPNPFVVDLPFADQIAFRGSGVVYYFVLLALVALTYRPGLMLWGALVGAASWGAGLLRVAMLPETKIAGPRLTSPQTLDALGDLSVLLIGPRVQELVVLVVVSAILAAVVARSRVLAARQIVAERQRANLARHFPPGMVDALANNDNPFASVREQAVAVMFADVVGFTRRAESEGAAKTVELLRELHRRLESAVFEFGGTLDKFMGDGIMATFGTPLGGARDALNALASARAIVQSIEAWNEALRRDGAQPIEISIGLHFGPVVIGDLGTERQLELAVIGDTVNVASRLERLTRDLGGRLVVSEDFLRAAREQAGGDSDLFAGFDGVTPVRVRGREAVIHVWTWSGPSGDPRVALGNGGAAPSLEAPPPSGGQ